jgi:hypothetical protein
MPITEGCQNHNLDPEDSKVLPEKSRKRNSDFPAFSYLMILSIS